MRKSGLTNARMVMEGTLIVTVDIGMRKNHGYCTAADGRSSKRSSLRTRDKGLMRCGQWCLRVRPHLDATR